MVEHRRFWVMTLVGFALLTLAFGWSVNRYFVDKNITAAAQRLELYGNLRREAMQRYLDTAEAELRFWSSTEELHAAQSYFRHRWQELVAAGGDPEARLRELYIEENPHPIGQRRELRCGVPFRNSHIASPLCVGGSH